VFSPHRDPTAAIGHAVSDDEGESWTYTGLALDTDHHLSFPYVFAANDEIYMVPDIANSGDYRAPARLYRTTAFPLKWEPVTDIIIGPDKYQDTVVFQWGSRWWAITGTGSNDELSVYYSETLTTPDGRHTRKIRWSLIDQVLDVLPVVRSCERTASSHSSKIVPPSTATNFGPTRLLRWIR